MNDSPLDDSFLSFHFSAPGIPLFFFDAYDSSISTDFHDALARIPDLFYSCYGYQNPLTNISLNWYKDTCTKVFYNTTDDTTVQYYISNAINVLNCKTMAQSILRNTLTKHKMYHHIPSSTSQYHFILFQAQCLQTIMFRSNSGLQLPLQNPFIYLSSDIAEPPIVIDTGASLSITPTAIDFTQEIVAFLCTSLNQLSGKTVVVGKGLIKWDIEEVTGVRRQLMTHAYYVPTATIRLFSPQAYIGNNVKAQLLLTSKRTYLTPKCDTLLQFPLNPSSNLPFMLTEIAANRNRKLHREQCQSTHVTALRFAESLGFPSTISNAHYSIFSPHSRIPITQDKDISIPLNGPDSLTQIIVTNLNHNTEHAVHQIQNISRFTCQKKCHKSR